MKFQLPLGRRVIHTVEPPGLGDRFAAVAEPVKAVLVRIPGLAPWLARCGCEERRARWNRAWRGEKQA